ncbi:cysteine-rich secretory protein 3-like [Ostrea edulis]|uniref:cysteine-rich secretory protein 3-like n=1 Tax=Ostrea edulis TaxID=37623 RepID=UPI0024AED292|nr:cysteine-rich secretory protein 3-like [Ostrea edulis]
MVDSCTQTEPVRYTKSITTTTIVRENGGKSHHREEGENVVESRLVTCSWDDDVALVAQKWAENCELKHDGNYQRRIPGRFSTGQNLLWARYKSTWNVTIYSWYAEVYEFTYGKPIPPGVGHYTQIVWADSIKVGCGYAHCQAKGVHYYVCNYSPA